MRASVHPADSSPPCLAPYLRTLFTWRSPCTCTQRPLALGKCGARRVLNCVRRYNTPEITSLDHIQRCMREGQYLLPVHDSATYPITPPPELAAVVGDALQRFMDGKLSLFD